MLCLLRRASTGLKPMLIRALATEVQASTTRKTCLYDFHVAKGGRMVEFAGFLLPVQYASEGLSVSHRHVRSHCGIFDVSHMLQTKIKGRDRVAFLESLCVADIQGLPDNGAALTVFTTPKGGVIDDLVVTRTPLGYLYVVSNAGRRAEVKQLLAQHQSDWLAKGRDVSVQHLVAEDWALLAVQGPSAAKALQPLLDVDLSQMRFMSATLASVDGHPRSVCEHLLSSSEAQVQLAGLGARDSLRVEAGLCLYGAELSESISPIEAGLAWVVAKRRREAKDFPGAATILEQLRQGPARKRVGLRSQGPPARGGAAIFDLSGAQVGHVTSGCPSPSLGGNVAMGYVESRVSKSGTKLRLLVRNTSTDAEVTKMPFIKTNYFIPGKSK